MSTLRRWISPMYVHNHYNYSELFLVIAPIAESVCAGPAVCCGHAPHEDPQGRTQQGTRLTMRVSIVYYWYSCRLLVFRLVSRPWPSLKLSTLKTTRSCLGDCGCDALFLIAHSRSAIPPSFGDLQVIELILNRFVGCFCLALT